MSNQETPQYCKKMTAEEMKAEQILTTQSEFLKLGKVIAEKEFLQKKKEKKILKVKKSIFDSLNIPDENYLEYLDQLSDVEFGKIVEKMNIKFPSSLFENGNTNFNKSLKKYLLNYYKYISIKDSIIEEKDRELSISKEQIDELNESSTMFIEDADQADNTNKKLTNTILKLKEACTTKNTVIHRFNNIFGILLSIIILQNYSLSWDIVKYMLYLPLYYFESINDFSKYFHNSTNYIEGIYFNLFIHICIIMIGIIQYYCICPSNKLK